jgi:hypothetical protein
VYTALLIRPPGVRLYPRVIEEPVEREVRLCDEHIRVERRPVDRPASEADLLRRFCRGLSASSGGRAADLRPSVGQRRREPRASHARLTGRGQEVITTRRGLRTMQAQCKE